MGAVLVLVAVFLIGVAIAGLIRGRLPWTRVIATRRDAVVALVVGFALFALGGALLPAETEQEPAAAVAAPGPSSTVAAPIPSSVPSASPSSTPSPSVTPTATTTPSAAPTTASPLPTASVERESGRLEATRKYVPPVSAYAEPRGSNGSVTGRTSAGSSSSGGGSTDTYTNVDGNEVQRPTHASTAPDGASAQCRDDTYSFSQNRRGTCSGHGGVARWL